MANIDHYLEDIEVASRGEEVRDSIIDAFEALNSEGPGTMKWENITDTPDTLTGYGVSDVPASMVSGVLALNNIPPSALERVVPVANDTARFALTLSDVQNGDTVKVLSTQKLYLVVDDTSLSTEAGYEEYRAGTADSVDWSGVLNTPDTLAGYGIEDAYTKDEVDDITTSEEEESEAGNPITIETDAAQYAKNTHLTLEPVQDLHGYDHPWAGGAGKNLFDEQYPNIDGSMRRIYVQTGDGTFTLSTTAQIVEGATANLFLQAGQATSGESTTNNGVYSGMPRTVTATDGYVTISYRIVNNTPDAGNPLNCKTQLEVGSTATPYEPYSNICPITPMGHRNLLPMTVEGIKAANTAGAWSGDAYTYRGITYTVYADTEGNVTSIKVVGTSTASSMMYLSSATSSSSHISFDGKQPFIISGGAANVRAMVWLYDSNNAFVINVNSTGLDAYINADQGYTYYCPLLEISSGVTVDATVYPMLRPASDPDSTFVPYGMARVGAKVTGKNLFGDATAGMYTETGEITYGSTSDRWAIMLDIPVESSDYCLSINDWHGYKGSLGIYSYDANKNFLRTETFLYANKVTPPHTRTFSVHSDAKFLCVSGYNSTSNGGIQMILNGTAIIQFEEGSTATDYEPYKGYTASIDLPETVYGGTLDLETGVVVADMGIVDLGTLWWNYVSGNNSRMEASFTLIKNDDSTGTVPINAICSIYSVTSSNAVYNHISDRTIAHHRGLGKLWVYDSAYTDAAAFKTAMSGVQLCYELDTPKTYQLTPQQLALFKGINNISTNAKTVRVTYRNGELATTGDIVESTEVAKKNILGESASYTDARLATELAPILGNFATAENSPASASHAVGEYLLYNNRLYKVLAAISAGQQLTIGTNIGQTNVAAELTSLNSKQTETVACSYDGTSFTVYITTFGDGLKRITISSSSAVTLPQLGSWTDVGTSNNNIGTNAIITVAGDVIGLRVASGKMQLQAPNGISNNWLAGSTVSNV